MGTLTGNSVRLPEFCEHKLPTSCRLFIPNCCACADERAHAASYSTYIDGVGFVLRGTRWQRYCWFCKEFWKKRVEISGLRPGETSIPEVPDQGEFLRRWYEFHQGFRIVRCADGTAERVAVLGEDFKNVSPGYLPRTLEELRAGREQSEMIEREQQHQQRNANGRHGNTDIGPTLEQTLDQMFQEAEAEENAERVPNAHLIQALASSIDDLDRDRANNHAPAMPPQVSRSREFRLRRVAALRRELHRMRHGIERVISGLRELGEDVPDHTEATGRLEELGRTLDTISGPSSQEASERAIDSVDVLTRSVNAGVSTQSDRTLERIQARANEARQHVDEARRSRDQAASELDAAEQELRSSQSRLRQIQNEQRTTENYMRLFGTREEMLAQGENYESPIGGMFTRAWERFQVAEDVRREERTLRRVLEDEARVGDSSGEEAANRLAELEAQRPDIWGVPRPLQSAADPPLTHPQPLGPPLGAQRWSEVPGNRGRFGPPQTDGDLRGEEVGLEAYYAALRRQNWSHRALLSTAEQDREQRDESPDQRRSQQPETLAENTVGETNTSDAVSVSTTPSPPRGVNIGDMSEASLQELQDEQDRWLDAEYVLNALANSEPLRSALPWNPSLPLIMRLRENVQRYTLSWADRENVDAIMENTDVVWSCGLPAERNWRRRQRGEDVTFTLAAQELAISGLVVVHDVEIMAECFERSSRVRRQSGLTAPEQLSMLYRLQRGRRDHADVEVLAGMLRNEQAMTLAMDIQTQNPTQVNQEQTARQAALETERNDAARQGDHSRSELDAQRRATRAFALAAGRTAMRTGPTALLEQMASRDEETRVAYHRLQENGFVPFPSQRIREALYQPLNLDDFAASPSATDSDDPDSDDQARGLDAKDSGRPTEPLTDEQMTIKMECRICYTQLADVACLPCGHLVMCKWCSDQHSPVMAHDRTRPRRAAGCPVCRKGIRQKVRVFRA